MKTMKTLKYFLLLFFSVGIITSCWDDEAIYELNDDGPNLVGFRDANTTIGGIANGDEYSFLLPIKVFGPTVTELTAAVTATVETSTGTPGANEIIATEGVHYRLDNPTITLEKGNNYLGNFPITLLSEGIVAPLAQTPVVFLRVTQVDGAGNVLHSGKPIKITLNYLCFSNLAGNYKLTIERTSTTGANSVIERDEVITETATGTYRTTYVGHWTPDQLAPGKPGFTFTDVCNNITIAEQNLADYWANIVTGQGAPNGTYNPETGTIYLEYTVCASGACNIYKCTYVRQ